MAKAMGVGVAHLTEHPVMPEQRAEPSGSHGLTPLSAFQGDEQRGRVGQGPFQAQIVSEHLNDFRGQRHDALLVSFSVDPHLVLGELQVFQLKPQDLAGTQTVEEHQAHQAKIAKGAEASPELRDFIGRERHDDSPVLFEAQSQGDGAARPAIAERGSCSVGALEVDFAGGNVPTGVKAIPTMHHSQTMIDGLGSGLRILLKLMPDIIDERGLGDLGERLALRFEPAGEVEQVIGVGTERTQGELPEALAGTEG